MECNIDDRGARVRRVWGTINLLVGALVAGVAWWWGIWWLWIIAAACAAGGAFALFEAKQKWCVVRAMGMKTPV